MAVFDEMEKPTASTSLEIQQTQRQRQRQRLPVELIEKVLLASLSKGGKMVSSYMPFSPLLDSQLQHWLHLLTTSMPFQLCRSLQYTRRRDAAPSSTTISDLRSFDWILSLRLCAASGSSSLFAFDTTFAIPRPLPSPPFLTSRQHADASDSLHQYVIRPCPQLVVTHIASSASLACLRLASGTISVFNPLNPWRRPHSRSWPSCPLPLILPPLPGFRSSDSEYHTADNDDDDDDYEDASSGNPQKLDIMDSISVSSDVLVDHAPHSQIVDTPIDEMQTHSSLISCMYGEQFQNISTELMTNGEESHATRIATKQPLILPDRDEPMMRDLVPVCPSEINPPHGKRMEYASLHITTAEPNTSTVADQPKSPFEYKEEAALSSDVLADVQESISVLGLYSEFYGNPLRAPHFKVVVVRLIVNRREAIETMEYDSIMKTWRTTGKPPVDLTMKAAKGVCCKGEIYFLSDDNMYRLVPNVYVYNTQSGMWRVFRVPLPVQIHEFNARRSAMLSLFQNGHCEEPPPNLAHFTYGSLVECQGELYLVGAFEWKSFHSSQGALASYLPNSQAMRGGIKVWRFTGNFTTGNTGAWTLLNSQLVDDGNGTAGRDSQRARRLFKGLNNGEFDCTGIGDRIFFVNSKLSRKVYTFEVRKTSWATIKVQPLTDKQYSLLQPYHQAADDQHASQHIMHQPTDDDDHACSLLSKLPFQCFSISPTLL